MTGAQVGLLFAVFVACAVEAVEAATIVLAIGLTRGWRSAWAGVGAAVVVLSAVVAILGPGVTALPLGALRLVVGGLLLTFGLQWLRKAILRAGGLKALHDEDAIFERERQTSLAVGATSGRIDGYGFGVAFKGVLLEGLEVAFIVLTFGANAGDVGLAAVGALVAVLVVVAVALAARTPLSRVPENTMKFSVGVMLTSFGCFWGAEGAGVDWPGGDWALIGVVAFVGVSSAGLALLLRRRTPVLHGAGPA
jgi:uncharacterized membrane protein